MSTLTAAAPRQWSEPEIVAQAGPIEVVRVWLQDDGTFPNNAAFPLLVFRRAMELPQLTGRDGAALLTKNGWTPPWAWGVFEYHHYHSTAVCS